MNLRQMLLTILGLGAILGGVTLFQNCSGGTSPAVSSASLSVPPTLSGSYQVLQWTCGSINILANLAQRGVATTFTINGSNASQLLTTGNGCQESQSLGLAMPDQNNLNVTMGAISCTSSCSSAQCTPSTPNPAPTYQFAFQFSAPKLNLRRQLSAAEVAGTSLYGGIGCQRGDLLLLELSL